MSHERKNCEMVKPSQREALLIYLRQCLFEQRVIGLFLGHELLGIIINEHVGAAETHDAMLDRGPPR